MGDNTGVNDPHRWPTYNTKTVTLVEGVPDAEGRGSVRVRDTEGREYLDAVGGIGCNPLGHGHGAWAAAITEQLGKLATASNTYKTGPQQALAARLASMYPLRGDARVFLCTTGTESTEAGLKAVLKAGKGEGRDHVVAFEGAFHGRTLGALSLTGNPAYRAPFVHEPGEDEDRRFNHSKVLRSPFNDVGALRDLFAAQGKRIAAVCVEPIQGESGIWPGTREFLTACRELCSEHGALLMTDEIQAGSGRTGSWSSWDTLVGTESELQPDVTWVAKALGNGFPVAAAIATGPVAEHMVPGTHGTTYGGNPVACAAALATIDIMDKEGLLACAGRQVGLLREVAAANPIAEVKEIRGVGAMIGIQVGERDAKRAMPLGPALLERGVLVTTPGGHTVRLLFPYRAERAEFEELWSALREAIAATA